MDTILSEKNPKSDRIEEKKRKFKGSRVISLNDSQLLAKRYLDIFLSIFLFVAVFSWLFPILGVAIKLTSKGPVFFRQLRHGKNNIPFYCYKFRTMYVNSDADTQQAVKNDPRLTVIGGFLRKTSLDELPQFFNVLKGDMSIVGPRPHAVPMNDRFSVEIHNFMSRHRVKPGITGLAQAKGFRGETKNFYDIYSRCKLDLFYVKNWTPFLDIKIILWTVVSLILDNEKAY